MNTDTTRPPLVALVYRANKGCRQYPFGTADELEAWAARHPYRNEILKVHPVAPNGKFGAAGVMPAGDAAAYVRNSRSQPVAKHTPGPWKVGHDTVNGTRVDANLASVAFCGLNGSRGPNGWHNITTDEAAANARLIASAPDLLAELQNIATASTKDWDEPSDFTVWAQSRAKAVITKATGVPS